MFDRDPLSAAASGPASAGAAAPAPPQRAAGRARVALAAGPERRSRLCDLAQAGSAKAFLPRVHGPVPEVVFLNTAGGLTGGDRLSYALALGPGAAAVGTTQTAERGYASAGGAPAVLDIALDLGAGARLDWLPQETILYQDAALARRTRADLGPGARLLMAEMTVLGRAAMGERLSRLDFSDRREVWRGGRPVLVDPFRLEDGVLDPEGAARPALLDGARAIAVVALVAEGAEDAAGPLRAALAGCGAAEVAVSGWDGRALVRIRAADGLPLKRAVAQALEILRGGAALPRVWQI